MGDDEFSFRSTKKSQFGVEMKEHFGVRHGHARPWIKGDYQPILVRAGIEAAENVAPRKLPLAGQFRMDEALVEGAAFGIGWRAAFIKRMGMRQQQQLNSAVSVGQNLDLESPAVRAMDAKLMRQPTGYWQGAGLPRQPRRQNRLGNNVQVLKIGFSGNARNHSA